MAKECLKVKHRKVEARWAEYEKKLAAIVADGKLSKEEREEKIAALEAERIKNRLYKARRYHRCAVTGRSRGYYRFFGVCRQVLREMAHKGMLPGVTKSSW
ncbi:MAG TPA: 30S ribosomal protein S14 [Fimbriimonadaceae bacterium]|nr:30S ribosomal protein S14 [Fimbriimonadaceae bacterium]